MAVAKKHEITFEPIEAWPGKRAAFRKSSQFKSSLEKTQQLLDRELTHLNAKSVVLQVSVRREDIRLDGGLRAGVNPKLPGVILSFSCKHGQLMYPCDTFTDWKDNLRAIALVLEALRSVDRYGVTSRAEQYRGWQQLPRPEGPTITNKEQAFAFLSGVLGYTIKILEGRELIQGVIRQAQLKTHPDKQGNPEDFKRVMECERLLLS